MKTLKNKLIKFGFLLISLLYAFAPSNLSANNNDKAKKEIEKHESFEYYELQQKNLGYRFLNEIKNTIDRILYFPSAWQKITDNTRRCLVKNFPYGVIYQKIVFLVMMMYFLLCLKKIIKWHQRNSQNII